MTQDNVVHPQDVADVVRHVETIKDNVPTSLPGIETAVEMKKRHDAIIDASNAIAEIIERWASYNGYQCRDCQRPGWFPVGSCKSCVIRSTHSLTYQPRT